MGAWTGYFFRTRGKNEEERRLMIRRVSGRNQLLGRVDSVRISGFMAEIKIPLPSSRLHPASHQILFSSAFTQEAKKELIWL